MRQHPHLFEVNAAVLVNRIARWSEQPGMSLARIPREYWRQLRELGFDLVWLMGVWRRSPVARRLALDIHELLRAYDQLVPGWREDDVLGSPYAVYDYSLEPKLGEPGELAGVRGQLNELGMGLILDFVPNHLAMDHPWTTSHPDRLVNANADRATRTPGAYFPAAGARYLAHGRDPHFPPWTDTVQVNFFSREARAALIDQVLEIAGRCDGIRCDMAMLGLNSVFERTWGDHLNGFARPAEEFWPEAIARVKQRRPGFTFIAEAYWGLEPELERMGFDFTYDKLFYDQLRGAFAPQIAAWLASESALRKGALHFIENHDEARAVEAMGRERAMLSAVMLATLPGMRLFQDGQLEGKRVHIPVQIAREPDEEPDDEMLLFFRRLFDIVDTDIFHRGEWMPGITRPAWEGNTSSSNVLTWYWRLGEESRIVAVNYSAHPAQARVKIPFLPSRGTAFGFHDQLGGETYLRAADELRGPGLYIALAPWKAHILRGPDIL